MYIDLLSHYFDKNFVKAFVFFTKELIKEKYTYTKNLKSMFLTISLTITAN